MPRVPTWAVAGITTAAVALAGCLAPASPRLTVGDAIVGAPLEAAGVGVQGSLEAPPDPCPVPPARETERGARHVIHRMWGCTAAAVSALDVHRQVAGPRVPFVVDAGFDRLVAIFHLHGGAEVRAVLVGPDETVRAQGTSAGGGGTESVVRFELAVPDAGNWTLAARVLDTVVLQGWSAVVEVGRP